MGGGRRIWPCLQRLLPWHVARPGLLVTAHAHLYRPTPRVSGLPVYIILRARLSTRTTTDTAARRTRLHISLPVSPQPRPLDYRYRRHCRRSPRLSPSPSSSGDRRRTGPYVYRRSPGRRHPVSQYQSPQLLDGHQRRRWLHNEFACTETGNSHTGGPLSVSPHCYAHHQQGNVTDATALVGRRPASPPPLTRVTVTPAQHDRRGACGSPPPPFRVPSPTRHIRRHARSSSRDSSQDERCPYFGTWHHSRASTSRSCSHSRSRSRSQDEYNTLLSFSSKLTLVHDIFAAEPSMQERSPMPPRSANVNVGSRRPSSSSSKPRSLPWNPSAARIHDSYWDLLRGKDPKSKSTDATGLPIGTYLKKPRFRDRYYHISGEPDAIFSAFVPSKFCILQPTDKSATHAKSAFTDADVADFEVQLKRTATILSFQDWFISAVLELSRQPPPVITIRHLDDSTGVLYSASRAGYDAQDHVSHLLFNLVLRRHDAYLRDTFTTLPTPTKRLLRSHWLNSRQLFNDEACTSAVETFTRASNVSLLTQAIKSRSAAPSRRSSATNADHRRCPPIPPRRQPSRDSSRSTRGKPRSFPSSFKKGGADLSTSIDLSPTDLSPSPATISPLPDFPVPALNDSPVGARLQLYWRNWQRIFTNPWVISVLRDGYYLPFSADPPPLTSDPPLLSYSHSHPLFQELTSQVQALLAKGPIEQTDFSPGFYSRLFLVPKQNGDWRPVINLSALNRYLSSPHFRMETVRSVMQSLPLVAWCTSIDLKDTFLHVSIARKHRKYLLFRIGGAAFQFRALPFGLTTSPVVFTCIVKTVGAYAHSQGLNILLYLDDWNISVPSPTLCARWTEWVLRLTASLGLIPDSSTWRHLSSLCSSA